MRRWLQDCVAPGVVVGWLVGGCTPKETPTPTDTDPGTPVDTDTEPDTDTDTEPPPPPPPPPPPDVANVRVVNTSQPWGTAFLFVCPVPKTVTPQDALAIVMPLTATGYGELPSGALTIGPTWFGEVPDCEDRALALETEPDKNYTVWIAGERIAPVFGYEQDDDVGIPAGQTRFTVHHTATGFDNVQFVVDGKPHLIEYSGSIVYERDSEEHTVEVDIDGDAVSDWAMVVPQAGPETTVPLFLALQGKTLGLIGLRPDGAFSILVGTPLTGTTDTGP